MTGDQRLALLEHACRLRTVARTARDRLHRARVAGGYAAGGPEAVTAVEKATAIVSEKYSRSRFFDAVPPSPARLHSTFVPEGYVSLRAEVLLGLEAELASAIERAATAEATLAEEHALG